ncbi:MAG: alanine--glyoxylate aminotransferase family protein [Deltaproteobacteria bacterium]|jgi:aspartate aminotransferase-like enzyme|nr:alanine--glyoxylate aminotransferase family protein [Deltaproteobacteria bacterium]
MLTKPRLLTPGPTLLPERIRLAMARDMLHHRTAAFIELMREVQAGLRLLFDAEDVVLPLASSGTGAMTAAVCALFAPGEKVLVVDGGKFGERWTKICRTQGLSPVVLSVPWGEAVSPSAVAEALDQDSGISGVLIQHAETSTGVQHPVEAVAAITRSRPVLLVVDGVSAVSITPCPMSRWGLDCLLTGSQKGLMLPPGLALISLSRRAWDKAESVPPRNFYFDLRNERAYCLQGQSAFTLPVSLLVGLAESLRLFAEVGLSTVYRKQWAMTALVRRGVAAMGLELFVKEHFAWGVTSILLPEGMASGPLLAHAAERYGVVMAAGQDAFKDRMVRMGHMGWLDYADLLAGLHALAGSFTFCGGYSGGRNYLEQAMEAYWAALDEGAPLSA